MTAAKQNVRVLTVPLSNAHNQYDVKRVSGGLLVQIAGRAQRASRNSRW